MTAFLGHYVGDGHMPLHITANPMPRRIDRTANSSSVRRDNDWSLHRPNSVCEGSSKPVKDVKTFVFNYLYKNNQSINQLLQADVNALKASGGQYNDVYYAALWNDTRQLTEGASEESSKKSAQLIYLAWIDAGKTKNSSDKSWTLIF